jgi:aromatic amino acid aminotransferase I / 2-aminoadipate transaminase
MSRGSWFRAEKGTDKELYLRATFAAAPKDAVSEAIRRLGEALKESFGIKE